ncbi:MAG: (d)CMP kinase [Micropruina sp.]|nr:MAG: (d)CMP kinase [Micropruina sp.]
MRQLVIAIDGPSGSGKSTTSRAVARALGLSYLDTGAMYRAVTVAFLDGGVDPSDVAGIIRTTVEANLEISTDPDATWVRIDGRDVTEEIREQRTSANASAVSTVPECRANLVARQQQLIAAAPVGIVAEGRDITTVVAPDADVRLLLTADPEIRMARRNLDLGGDVDAAALRDQVLRRDADDSTLVNFTEAADGVTQLDCTYLTLQETIDAVLELIAERTGVRAAGTTWDRT